MVRRREAGQPPVELRLDPKAMEVLGRGIPAGYDDFDTEFLDYILAVRVVDSVEEAIAHINCHSTGHSEAILTQTRAHADLFTRLVDSAAVYVNASHPVYRPGDSSAWAVRWGFPPKSSMPEAPWAWRS